VQVELVVGADGQSNAITVAPQIVEIAGSPGGEAQIRFAQPWGGGDETQHMLQIEQVQKELELVEEQRTRLRQLMEERQAETQRVFSELRGSTEARQPPRPDELHKRLREIETVQREKLDEILLPHQRKRLCEIALRTRLKNRGTVGTLADKELSKQLEISPEQQERLKKKAQEVQVELDKKIAKIREEAREEIFEELTISQRQKLKEMLGAEFDYRPQPIAPRIKSAPSVRTVQPRQ
jgi:hypothetical protein